MVSKILYSKLFPKKTKSATGTSTLPNLPGHDAGLVRGPTPVCPPPTSADGPFEERRSITTINDNNNITPLHQPKVPFMTLPSSSSVVCSSKTQQISKKNKNKSQFTGGAGVAPGDHQTGKEEVTALLAVNNRKQSSSLSLEGGDERTPGDENQEKSNELLSSSSSTGSTTTNDDRQDVTRSSLQNQHPDNNRATENKNTADFRMDVDVDNAANSLLVMLSSNAEASSDRSPPPNTISTSTCEKTTKNTIEYKNIHNIVKREDDLPVDNKDNHPDITTSTTKTQRNGLRGGAGHHAAGDDNPAPSTVTPSHTNTEHQDTSGGVAEQQAADLTHDATGIRFHAQNHIFSNNNLLAAPYRSTTEDSSSANIAASHHYNSSQLPHPYQQDPHSYHSQAHQCLQIQRSINNPYETSTASSPSKENNYLSNCKHCSKCKQFGANKKQILHEVIDFIFQRKLGRSRRRVDDAKDAERRTSAQGYEEVTTEQIEAIVTHGAVYGIELPIPTKLSCPRNVLKTMVYTKSASNKWANVESRRKRDDSSYTSNFVDGTDCPPQKRRKKIMTVNEKIIAMTMGSHNPWKDASRLQNSCFCENCTKITNEADFSKILEKIYIASYRLDPPSKYPNKGYTPIEKEHRDAIISTGANYGVDFPITTKLRHAEDFLRNTIVKSNREKIRSRKRTKKLQSKQVEVSENKSLDSATSNMVQTRRLSDTTTTADHNCNVDKYLDTANRVANDTPSMKISSDQQSTDEITDSFQPSQFSENLVQTHAARFTGKTPLHSKKLDSQRSFTKSSIEIISPDMHVGTSDCDEFDMSVRSSDAESVHDQLEDGEVFSAQEKHILEAMMMRK